MREVCGTCKYNKRTYDGHCNAEFCCGNENSDNYSVPTFYDDTCDDEEDGGQRMQEELKPCPFCGCGTGNLYIVTIEQHGFDTVGIFCNGCKQTMVLEENEWEGDNEQSRIKAIEAWNRRAEPITSPLLTKKWKCQHMRGEQNDEQ